MRTDRSVLVALFFVAACSKGALFTAAEPPPATYLKPGMAPEIRELDRPVRLTVSEAVNEALVQNRVVISARVQAAIASTNRREALAAMIPHVNIAGSYRRQDEPPRVNAPGFPAPIVTGVDQEWQGEIAMTFPIFAFGRYLNRYRSAKLTEGATVARQEVDEADIAASVTAAAFDLLEVVRQIEVASANEEALRRQVDDSEALLEAGRVTKASLLESQVQYDVAVREREKLESLVRIRRIVLNSLLGRQVDEPTEVVDQRIDEAPTWTFEEVERDALASRPELRAADLDLAATRKGYKSAVAAELPEFRGALSYSRTDNPFAAPQDPVVFRFTFDVPIFQGGGEYARVQRARYEIDLARIRRRDLEDVVRREVAEAFRNVQESYKDIAVAKRSVERQDEALRIRREEQANGKATTREVLDTISTLNNAQFALVASVYDYNIALRELHRARGADPRAEPRPSPPPQIGPPPGMNAGG
ncbi:MAG: TolC family protein [Planctomycetota bacterium]|jgi:outer membrane protein